MRARDAKRHPAWPPRYFRQFDSNAGIILAKVTRVTERDAIRGNTFYNQQTTAQVSAMTNFPTKVLTSVIGVGLLIWAFALISVFPS